jgi:hypothetical protein
MENTRNKRKLALVDEFIKAQAQEQTILYLKLKFEP